MRQLAFTDQSFRGGIQRLDESPEQAIDLVPNVLIYLFRAGTVFTGGVKRSPECVPGVGVCMNNVGLANSRVRRWLDVNTPETPFLVVDLDEVARKYEEFCDALPGVSVYFAVKSNPAPMVLSLLAQLGSRFDVASPHEIRLCLDSGAEADSLSFGNTVKKESAVAAAASLGVPLFVVDNERELHKIARAAPGADIYCRVQNLAHGAQWDLRGNFGCDAVSATHLLLAARDLGLRPRGVSFHVGSQQDDPRQWEANIEAAAQVFECVGRRGVRLDLLNIGGGFPAQYDSGVPPLAAFGRAIQRSIERHFPHPARIDVIAEPGRSIVASAGVLRAQVVSIRQDRTDPTERWVYLDAGRYGGLAETEGEAIRYPIEFDREGVRSPAVLAGPTCDSVDVLYQETKYELPDGLEIGDNVDFIGAGAYTASYSSVGFNGFPPLRTICLPSSDRVLDVLH